jgi:hypothetical protein
MEKHINFSISIREIIGKTLQNNPESECTLDYFLAYNAMDILLEKLNSELNSNATMTITKSRSGGKSNRRKKRNQNKKKRTIRRKKRVIKYRKQSGGANPQTILFFLSFFLVLIQGIQFMDNDQVMSRLNDAYAARELFRNVHGTCAVNSLLFLKAIKLDDFRNLSLQIISRGTGLTEDEMSLYLHKKMNVASTWQDIVETPYNNELLPVQNYIMKIKNKLIELRIKEGREGQELMTPLNYPIKSDPDIGHAIVVWLTADDDLIFIDPQRFYYERSIVLYSSNHKNPITGYNVEGNRHIVVKPLEEYVSKNVDLYSMSSMLLSMHIEIEDSNEYRYSKELPTKPPVYLRGSRDL